LEDIGSLPDAKGRIRDLQNEEQAINNQFKYYNEALSIPEATEEELDNIAKTAKFNGFIPLQDLKKIMQAEKCAEDVLQKLWHEFQCDIITKEYDAKIFKGQSFSWSILLNRFTGLAEYLLGSLDLDLTPIQYIPLYQRDKSSGELKPMAYPDLCGFIKLDEFETYLKQIGQGYNIHLFLPRKLYPEKKKKSEYDKELPRKETISAVKSEDELTKPTIVFRQKKDEMWEIGLWGKELHTLPDLFGLHYIHCLLFKEPGERVSSTELRNLTSKTIQPKMTSEQVLQEGLCVKEEENLEKTDKQTIREVKQKQKQIRYEIEKKETECSSTSNPEQCLLFNEEIGELQKKENELINYLRETETKTGEPRKSGSRENARIAVRKDIVRAVVKIFDRAPELKPYLEDGTRINTSTDCYYCPDPQKPVTWVLSYE